MYIKELIAKTVDMRGAIPDNVVILFIEVNERLYQALIASDSQHITTHKRFGVTLFDDVVLRINDKLCDDVCRICTCATPKPPTLAPYELFAKMGRIPNPKLIAMSAP